MCLTPFGSEQQEQEEEEEEEELDSFPVQQGGEEHSARARHKPSRAKSDGRERTRDQEQEGQSEEEEEERRRLLLRMASSSSSTGAERKGGRTLPTSKEHKELRSLLLRTYYVRMK